MQSSVRPYYTQQLFGDVTEWQQRLRHSKVSIKGSQKAFVSMYQAISQSTVIPPMLQYLLLQPVHNSAQLQLHHQLLMFAELYAQSSPGLVQYSCTLGQYRLTLCAKRTQKKKICDEKNISIAVEVADQRWSTINQLSIQLARTLGSHWTMPQTVDSQGKTLLEAFAESPVHRAFCRQSSQSAYLIDTEKIPPRYNQNFISRFGIYLISTQNISEPTRLQQIPAKEFITYLPVSVLEQCPGGSQAITHILDNPNYLYDNSQISSPVIHNSDGSMHINEAVFHTMLLRYGIYETREYVQVESEDGDIDLEIIGDDKQRYSLIAKY